MSAFPAACGIAAKPVCSVGTLVIGGGPAGLAPLLAASRGPQLDQLLQDGVAVVERGDHIGAGRLRRYLIRSDSAAETFLSAVKDHPDAGIAALAEHPLGRALAEHGRGAVPLQLAGDFMALLGGALERRLRSHRNGHVLTGHAALFLRGDGAGGWHAGLECLRTGARSVVSARAVLLAMGGQPVQPDGVALGGVSLATLGEALVHSDQLLDQHGWNGIEQRLRGLGKPPRIVVLGGSTSAVASVRLLLQRLGSVLEHGALTLMHRRAPKPWYRTEAEAHADGYTDFGPDDLCPVSGMVHRFGGIRFDSRDVVRGALGLGGCAPDPRLQLWSLASADPARLEQTGALLRNADLVVSALGYRPSLLPILRADGTSMALAADQPGGGGELVGQDAAVIDRDGQPIRGVFGIGLAAGYRPDASLGGEPSFRGQVNGLWLWQNDVGRMIADRLVAAQDLAAQDLTSQDLALLRANAA